MLSNVQNKIYISQLVSQTQFSFKCLKAKGAGNTWTLVNGQIVILIHLRNKDVDIFTDDFNVRRFKTCAYNGIRMHFEWRRNKCV